jgi:putative sigma-54 modulation protein
MRIDFKFRHTPLSDELTNYVSERTSKLEKFEMKPVRVEVTFSAEKTVRRVDIHARGEDIEMHSHCEAEDFFTAVDIALEKMARQLARKKAKVQKHKDKAAGERKSPKVS